MKKTIIAKSGHAMFLKKVEEFPILANYEPEKYTSLYTVHNWGADGTLFFHLARCKDGEWHVWYRGGEMWSSMGFNMMDAINGAQRDGWLYA